MSHRESSGRGNANRREFLQIASASAAALAGTKLVASSLYAQSQAAPAAAWRQAIERPWRVWDYDSRHILGHFRYDLLLWDAQTGGLVQSMQGFGERIYASQLSPDGKHGISSTWIEPGDLLIRSRDTRIILWDIVTGERKHEFPNQAVGEFSPDGSAFVCFSQNAGPLAPSTGPVVWPPTDERWDTGPSTPFDRATVWDTTTGEAICHARLAEPANLATDLLHFSPDGKSFVYLRNARPLHDNNTSAILYSAVDGKEQGRVDADSQPSGSHRFVTENRFASLKNQRAEIVSISTGRAEQTSALEAENLWGAAWTHDGKKVAALSREGQLTVLDISTGQRASGTAPIIDAESQTAAEPLAPRFAIVSPDNQRLAIEAGTDDEYPELRLYDMNTAELIVATSLQPWSHLVGFAPDARTLLVGGPKFVILDAADGQALHSWTLFDEDTFAEDWNA